MTDPPRDISGSLRGLFGDLAERSRSLREDVMRENERLRLRIQELESDMATAELLLTQDWDKVQKERHRLQTEAAKLAAEKAGKGAKAEKAAARAKPAKAEKAKSEKKPSAEPKAAAKGKAKKAAKGE